MTDTQIALTIVGIFLAVLITYIVKVRNKKKDSTSRLPGGGGSKQPSPPKQRK